MNARRLWLRWVGAGFLLLLAGFCILWIAGPTPVQIGPYVQNVTGESAEVCWFAERPRRLQLEVEAVRSGSPAQFLRPAEVRQVQRIPVGGLAPGVAYEYVLTDAETGELLATGSFCTPPAGTDARFSFAAVGDSGRTPRWFPMRRFGWHRLAGVFPEPREWEVARWMAARTPDLFLHLGDVIYSHDQLPAYEEAFSRPFAPVLRRAPAVVTLGNHDMHRWEQPEFFRLFQGPRPMQGPADYPEFSHTFTWGAVRFLVVDVFWQKWEEGSKMHRWLVRTLQENTLPRTVVVMHNPVFSDEAGVTENALGQQRLWPLFVRHRVDLVLSGDSHSYQRFPPIDGVTQVIVGTGGKSIRPVRPRRLAHHEERFGFLLVKVVGTGISGEFWAGGPEPLDRFTLPPVRR